MVKNPVVRTARHPYDALRVIVTPKEGMGHANPAAYAAAHVRQMRALRRSLPDLGFQEPWQADTGIVPWIAGGKWIVTCPCGDYPIASPSWDEARCFSCGAIYTKLHWPADRSNIEGPLLERESRMRTWFPHETADDLHAQNALHKGRK